jgi:acetoacetyl-CoA synthetase
MGADVAESSKTSGSRDRGTVLWGPSERVVGAARVTQYLQWLERERDLRFDDHDALWHWSVDELEAFWASVWDYFGVAASQPYAQVLTDRRMPGAQWFTGARLNYAEHVLRHASPEHPAIVSLSEGHEAVELSRGDLRRHVGALAAGLRGLGVRPGDRVVAYMPSIPETVIALLAVTSIGAVWAACAPDFGTATVIDRFAQVRPVVLIAADGYRFAGHTHDRRGIVAELQRALPTLRHTVLVSYVHPEPPPPAGLEALRWDDLVAGNAEPVFEHVAFDHPLWILYSSGTTGPPKCIVHGHGGILLEHLKALGLGLNVGEEDRYFFYGSTSWSVWNFLVGGLLLGATVVLYDGSPRYPDVSGIWRVAAATNATIMGTGAAYLMACQKEGAEPARDIDLSALRHIVTTGSPLPETTSRWVYEHAHSDVWLDSSCGGTDACTPFVGGSALLPVYANEIQGRCLGVSVEAWNGDGHPVIGEVGELVVTEPMPSMPLFFWNDRDGSRYRESYFDVFPGVWRQGDWLTLTERGSAIISGRSDATLNKMGVRMGSAEIYAVVERFSEVMDSLVVGVEMPGGSYYMPLFVVPAPGVEVDDRLREKLSSAISGDVSPRHVPDEIHAAPAVPRTLTGKKLEVPIKRLFQGATLTDVMALDAIENPSAATWYADFAARRTHGTVASSHPK